MAAYQNEWRLHSKKPNFGRLVGSATAAYQMRGVFVFARGLVLAGWSSAAAAYQNEGCSRFQKGPNFGRLVG